MGNCQAAEAAAVVIQHPGGKVERLYGAATAGEVMRSNPGHYVALVVLRVAGVGGGAKPDPMSAGAATAAGGGGGVTKITKVKLLKPKDALLLGQVYRLITSQEVAKAIQARRQDKTRRCEEQEALHAGGEERGQPAAEQERKRADRERRSGSGGGGGARGGGRHWRPSLQSISESAS